MHRHNRITMVAMVCVLLMVMIGCAHVAKPQLGSVSNTVPNLLQHPVPSSQDEDWTSYVLADLAVCRTHVCIEARGEGRAYLVNGQLLQVGDMWVLGKGLTVVSIANPAIPDNVWTTTPALQPGLWRLEVAITPTAPLQSYGQLERFNALKGWVLDGYTIFINPTRIMLPNRVPSPATIARNL